VGPEAVNVNLHTHSSPSSEQAGDEPAVRDDGETWSATVGAAVGVGATGRAVGVGAVGTGCEVLNGTVGVAAGVLAGCAEAAGVGEMVRVGTDVGVTWCIPIEGTGVACGDFVVGCCGTIRAENGVAGGTTWRCGRKAGESTSSVIRSRQVIVISIHSRRRRVEEVVGTASFACNDFTASSDGRESDEKGTIIAVE
jgi:hypothetical protein